MVVFTCNHCPTAQAYEDRLIRLTADYKDKGVALVAIMPNDPTSINLDELGYTDMGDSFEEMKLRAKEKNFNFPYLYDGETEKASLAYGPIATPHVFIFDKNRILRYSGRIDDMEKPTKPPTVMDARAAIDELLAGIQLLDECPCAHSCLSCRASAPCDVIPGNAEKGHKNFIGALANNNQNRTDDQVGQNAVQ